MGVGAALMNSAQPPTSCLRLGLEGVMGFRRRAELHHLQPWFGRTHGFLGLRWGLVVTRGFSQTPVNIRTGGFFSFVPHHLPPRKSE